MKLDLLGQLVKLDLLSLYTDLHLDIKIAKSIGIGNKPVDSRDILVDEDILAVKNSIKNIFSTKKGEKLLAPDFGSALEQYLFQPVSESMARLIGQEILNDLVKFEPRIEVEKIKVLADPDNNQYNITIAYRFLEIKKQSSLNILALQGGEVII